MTGVRDDLIAIRAGEHRSRLPTTLIREAAVHADAQRRQKRGIADSLARDRGDDLTMRLDRLRRISLRRANRVGERDLARGRIRCLCWKCRAGNVAKRDEEGDRTSAPAACVYELHDTLSLSSDSATRPRRPRGITAPSRASSVPSALDDFEAHGKTSGPASSAVADRSGLDVVPHTPRRHAARRPSLHFDWARRARQSLRSATAPFAPLRVPSASQASS